MTAEHKGSIRKHLPAMIDEMEPASVANRLYSDGGITARQLEEIKSKSTRLEQVECLVNKVLVNQDATFDKLANALKATGQHQLSSRLSSSYGK